MGILKQIINALNLVAEVINILIKIEHVRIAGIIVFNVVVLINALNVIHYPLTKMGCVKFHVMKDIIQNKKMESVLNPIHLRIEMKIAILLVNLVLVTNIINVN